MLTTWIESPARGRLGGPMRAGMWSAVVLGTHPIEPDQEVVLEISSDDVAFGPLPAFWLENKGGNSLWHVPIPPQAVDARLKFRAVARRGDEQAASTQQEVVVRANLPDRTEFVTDSASVPEGLAGNRRMTIRVDSRGSTYDLYYPTVGLHSEVRPAEGDVPRSRCHFRAIVGGIAIGRRLDWFTERQTWDAFQRYQGSTNHLITELTWRRGEIRALVTDFAVTGPNLPRTQGGAINPGQYLKRFTISNDGDSERQVLLGIYVEAEVNGGVGEPGVRWLDSERVLIAYNRGHGHTNRKLSRDATVEFGLVLDGGDVTCETTGPNEAMMLCRLKLAAASSVTVDLLVSAAYTGWRGDSGTFDHWLRPAIEWFKSADRSSLEHEATEYWSSFVDWLPTLDFAEPGYAVALRRSALAALLHSDSHWGAFASGFERGLHAYCWPREAIWAGAALTRAGLPAVGRKALSWLAQVRGRGRAFTYWFQKYSIDGVPEWETPAIDQTALIPWALEQHYRRTGEIEFVASLWPMVEQAVGVCLGQSRHPGLAWLDDLSLYTSAGIWDTRYGAYSYSNVCVVAGLQAAAKLAEALDRSGVESRWLERADRVWNKGILAESAAGRPEPGLVDGLTGRFLDARRLSLLRGLWSSRSESLLDRSAAIDICQLAPCLPFGLLPATDSRVVQTFDAIQQHNKVHGDSYGLCCWTPDPSEREERASPGGFQRRDVSSLATLWAARYLLQLGKETGEGRHWQRALAYLDDILERLGPLGLLLHSGPRRNQSTNSGYRPIPGVWALHTMLIETLLDIAGLRYDAVDRVLSLSPILPSAWPFVGAAEKLACGQVRYRLERDGAYRLLVETDLNEAVSLKVGITCPGLDRFEPWPPNQGETAAKFDAANHRVSWSADLPPGPSRHEWTFG